MAYYTSNIVDTLWDYVSLRQRSVIDSYHYSDTAWLINRAFITQPFSRKLFLACSLLDRQSTSQPCGQCASVYFRSHFPPAAFCCAGENILEHPLDSSKIESQLIFLPLRSWRRGPEMLESLYKVSVVISRPRSRDSSALEFIFRRSRSWSLSWPKGQGLGLGLE